MTPAGFKHIVLSGLLSYKANVTSFCENNNFHVNCAFVIIFNEMVQNGKR